MATNLEDQTTFQWKWVGSSLLLYIVFYFIPLTFIPGGVFTEGPIPMWSAKVVGAWAFSGIFIIAAASGYLSKGVTILEPVVASIGLTVIFMLATKIKFNHKLAESAENETVFITLGIAFLMLSFCGAWMGERIQNPRPIIDTSTKDAEPKA